MKINGVDDYFRYSRRKHGRVTKEIARSVVAGSRSIFYPPREEDGRIEVFGYAPALGDWVEIILNPGNILFNGFVEPEAKEIMRRRAREGR